MNNHRNAGIIEEFDYHDSMDAENYEKYFEKICKLLKPNSLIIIDNASYPGGGGGTHDIFGRGCATIKSLYRPFLEFLTKKLDPFRNFCA